MENTTDRDAAVGDEGQSDPDELPMTNDTGVAADEKNPLHILASPAVTLGRLESSSSQIIFQENQEPPSQYDGIIGRGWTGPFEKKLTETEVKEYSITIKKSEFDKFIKPLLSADDQEDLKEDGIPVKIYSNEHVKEEFYMTLKVVKSDDSDGMYALFGLKQKDFCENIIMSVIKVDAFFMIWMFRHAQDKNLCSAITLGRLAPPPSSSEIIFQENQDPPSQYEDIIGECRGPFSKKLTHTDVNSFELIIRKKHSRGFIEPLLQKTDGDLKEGVQVTMFNDADEKETNFLMNLKVRESGQYSLTDGWKEFCQTHESMIKVDEYVTLWMFLHKAGHKLCSIITSGRVVEKNNLPKLPPVEFLARLNGKYSEPFVKKLPISDVAEGRDVLRFSKIDFREYLEHLLYGAEKKVRWHSGDSLRQGWDGFSMILKKWTSKERALTQGWREFRKTHNLIQNEEFFIWMFRDEGDQKLGFVMISKELVTAAENEPALLQGKNLCS